MIKSPKVIYRIVPHFVLPQSAPSFAIHGAPSPLLAHAGDAPSTIFSTRASTVSEIVLLAYESCYNNCSGNAAIFFILRPSVRLSAMPAEDTAERMIYEILHLGEEHGRITCAGYSDQGKARKTG